MARRVSRRLWLAAATLAAGPTLATTRQEPQPPVFRSDVELVTVDAVVVDAQGLPVAGLTREDFVVLEGGQPQEIVAFDGITPAVPPARPAAAEPSASASASPPARVVTNAGEAAAGATFLVVVDDIHLSERGAVEARGVLERFLRETCRAGDRVAIVSTRAGAAWSGDAVDDASELVAFVAGLRSRAREAGLVLMTEYEALRISEYGDTVARDRVEGRYWLQRRCFEGPKDCSTVVQADAHAVHSQAQQDRRVSLAAVEAAIDTLGRGKRRKAVLLLTEGFPHDSGEKESRRVVSAAARANAAVYFVDVRGVTALAPWASADAPNDAALNSSRMSPDSVVRITRLMGQASRERLQTERYIGVETIAQDTGGQILRGTNDLGPGLERVAAESRSYYLLGYQPSGSARGGRFREIELRVRSPGMTVRARKGYERGTTAVGPAPARDAAAELPMRLASYVLEPAGAETTRVVAVVEIDLAAASGREPGRGLAQLELSVQAMPLGGGEGRAHRLSLESERRPARAGVPASQWRAARVEFELAAGVHQVRASVREPASGRVGTVAQRIVVLEREVFRASTPIFATAVAAGGAPTPVAHRSFSNGAGRALVCAFEVMGATRDSRTDRPNVAVGFELQDASGSVLATLPPASLAPGADGRVLADLALPLAQLPPGEYVLVLAIEDRVVQKTERLREGFLVEPAAGTTDAPRREPAPEKAPLAGAAAPPP